MATRNDEELTEIFKDMSSVDLSFFSNSTTVQVNSYPGVRLKRLAHLFEVSVSPLNTREQTIQRIIEAGNTSAASILHRSQVSLDLVLPRRGSSVQ